MKITVITSIIICSFLASSLGQANNGEKYVYKAGHPSLQEWILPAKAPHPKDNPPTPARIALGKKLFFDPRLSGDGSISCSTCHNPLLGWSDGLSKGIGFKGSNLPRATPSLINVGFNSIQMWDGRNKTLEEQAMGPMEASLEMNMDFAKLFSLLRSSKGYSTAFESSYPGEGINAKTVSKAIANFERTIISNDSPFDRWVKGDKNAMTQKQINGFKLFVGKANCEACHSAPNFTDDGFHNVGLASWSEKTADVGRFAQKPIRILKGAFKTPTLRDIERTAPYFHDGSSDNLEHTVRHYNKGGVTQENLDPNMKKLNLTKQEIKDIVSFMEALTSPFIPVSLPEVPYK